jgi:hypothetical protein
LNADELAVVKPRIPLKKRKEREKIIEVNIKIFTVFDNSDQLIIFECKIHHRVPLEN